MEIGFIGLGTMGGAMAANLLAAGHDLVVADIDPAPVAAAVERGARAAATPAEVAAGVDVVFTSLPGPDEVEAVVLGPDGVATTIRPGCALFDLTTSSPTLIRRIHDELSPRGIEVYDAPVSGGPDGAVSGRLAIWVGGDEKAFERWRPLLADVSDATRYIGPIGAGAVAKLVHNASGYIIQMALAETMSLGVKAGVDPDRLWEAVREGGHGRRRTFDGLARNYLPGRFDPPDFPLRLARKDVRLACDLGRDVEVPLRLANLVLQEMTEGMNRGWSERDSRSFMLLQEDRAGAEVRVDAERVDEILAAEIGSDADSNPNADTA